MQSERPHKKLIVWQEGIELARLCYEISILLPSDEKFGLGSQLKRASISVPANIAEGAARKTQKEFLYFLYVSSGSLSEVDTLNELMKTLNFINDESYSLLKNKVDKVSALLNGLISSKSRNNYDHKS
ncbi:MAG: four helix bundle protein [Bacteroidota bacterium]